MTSRRKFVIIKPISGAAWPFWYADSTQRTHLVDNGKLIEQNYFAVIDRTKCILGYKGVPPN